MKKVDIVELKRNLTRYLEQVKHGESILLFDRNQPIAPIIPVKNPTSAGVNDPRVHAWNAKG